MEKTRFFEIMFKYERGLYRVFGKTIFQEIERSARAKRHLVNKIAVLESKRAVVHMAALSGSCRARTWMMCSTLSNLMKKSEIW